MGVVNWEFRSSLSKGLSEPPRSAVAPRKARNTCFGVFLLLAGCRLRLRAERSEAVFILRLLCQKKSGKRFKMISSRRISFYEKRFQIAYPLFSLVPEAQMKTASLRSAGGASAILPLGKKEHAEKEISPRARGDQRSARWIGGRF